MNVRKLPVLLIYAGSFFAAAFVWANDNVNLSDKILIEENGFNITHEDALVVFDDIESAQLKRLAVNKSKLDKLLFQLFAHKKKVNEALKLGLDQNEEVQKKIEHATNNILVTALAKDAFIKMDFSKKNYEGIAKEYYQSHPEKYKVDPRVHAAHILFRVNKNDDEATKKSKSELADKVIKQLKGGYDFEIAVKEYTDEKATADNGGDLGYFTYGQMVPEFEKAAFALKNVGDISDVVKTQFGFHIIKLLDKVPASIKPFTLVKADLIKEEEGKYKKYKIEEYLASFNASDKATLNDSGVQKLQKILTNMAKDEAR